MLRHSLRGLAVAAVAAFTLGPAPAAAVTQLNDCAILTKAGETYVLTRDVSSSGSCFTIQADRITLDLGGHTVTGLNPSGSRGVLDEGNSRSNTVVRNGTLTNFGIGIFLPVSTRTTVRNITVFGNVSSIVIGSDSLVKDCTAQRSVLHGVEVGDRGQVENCVVGDAEPGAGVDGNGSVGIIGGQRILITRTKANGNGSSGILVGMRSTVTFNTASNNGNDGIAVGGGSLVTGNTANENGQDGITVGERSTVSFNTANDNGDNGIEAVCPSTILHNVVVGNVALPIRTIGQGCFVRPDRIPE